AASGPPFFYILAVRARASANSARSAFLLGSGSEGLDGGSERRRCGMRAERGGLVLGRVFSSPPEFAGSASKRFRSVFLATPSSEASASQDAPAAWRRCNRAITAGDRSGIEVRRRIITPNYKTNAKGAQ